MNAVDKYKCEICGETFRAKINFRNHNCKKYVDRRRWKNN